MPKASINQATLYYELHGQGQPLVLISGFGCDHSIWLPFLDFLAPNFTVLLLDNRGSGQTECHNENEIFTIGTLAEDIMTLIEMLKLNPPNILGHSMGGSIAQTFASLYPDKINKLVLLNTSPKTNTVAIKALSALIDLQEKHVDPNLIIDAFMPWGYSAEYLSDTDKIMQHKKTLLEYPFPQTLAGNRQQLNALQNFNGQPLLKKILAPTFIVGMERDLLVTREETLSLHQHILGAKLEMLQGSHLGIFEDPISSATMITKFLI